MGFTGKRGFVFEEESFMILGCIELTNLIFGVLKGVVCKGFFLY